jgi:hypothetical protein
VNGPSRELFGKDETESYVGEDALEEVLRARGEPPPFYWGAFVFMGEP